MDVSCKVCKTPLVLPTTPTPGADVYMGCPKCGVNLIINHEGRVRMSLGKPAAQAAVTQPLPSAESPAVPQSFDSAQANTGADVPVPNLQTFGAPPPADQAPQQFPEPTPAPPPSEDASAPPGELVAVSFDEPDSPSPPAAEDLIAPTFDRTDVHGQPSFTTQVPQAVEPQPAATATGETDWGALAQPVPTGGTDAPTQETIVPTDIGAEPPTQPPDADPIWNMATEDVSAAGISEPIFGELQAQPPPPASASVVAGIGDLSQVQAAPSPTQTPPSAVRTETIKAQVQVPTLDPKNEAALGTFHEGPDATGPMATRPARKSSRMPWMILGVVLGLLPVVALWLIGIVTVRISWIESAQQNVMGTIGAPSNVESDSKQLAAAEVAQPPPLAAPTQPEPTAAVPADAQVPSDDEPSADQEATEDEQSPVKETADAVEAEEPQEDAAVKPEIANTRTDKESDKARKKNRKANDKKKIAADKALKRGVAHLKSKKARSAIAELKKCTAMAPRNAMCWRNLGMAHVMNKQSNKAATAFERFLKLAPNHSDATKVRGVLKSYYKKRGKK